MPITTTVKIEGAAAHPTVYLTSADVRRGRENVKRFPWAREFKASLIKEADSWLTRDDAWYLDALPKAGASFAYGFNGCPLCGATWGMWGGVDASFDKPGQVTCKTGHVLPDAAHPDNGTGYTGPDGRIHYFIGSYNAWVIETITFKSIESLCYAYTLTGEDRYAAKAGFLLDRLAAMYPACDKGSWDYPSNPPSGRFNRPWYQVARVLVHYVDQYDQIFNSQSLDQASCVPQLTRRKNIETNLLLNGANYCYQQSLVGGLDNGEADYIRGALAVGICLGIPEYVRWAVDGPFGIKTLLENNIDRDGGYHETSMNYADHARDLYLSYAEPLLNYRGSAYPQGVDLFEHPKFVSFCLLHNLAQNCIGHVPRYGNSSPDPGRAFMSPLPADTNDYLYLERLHARGAGKSHYSQDEIALLMNWLSGGDPEAQRAKASLEEKKWLTFHASPVTSTSKKVSAELYRRVRGSDFLGQKGIGILRSGEGNTAQAALLRFGPALGHSHYDDLNLNYYGLGYELTYDLGYSLASTHTQVGWAQQTASHNLVVVDETTQGRQEDGGFDSHTGGSLHLFAELPNVRVIDASSNGSYRPRGVDLYRRTLVMIGQGEDAYLLDLFRVHGGRQHDYLLHAPTPNATFEGVALGEVQKGSLAGPAIDWLSKQLNDGDMEGYPNQPFWNPPPGNGYGFLSAPQQAVAPQGWSAEWTLDETTRLRATMPSTPETTAITALSPSIYPPTNLPQARYVISRRRAKDGAGLRSSFVAALEPYNPKTRKPLITGVERLSISTPSTNGTTDMSLMEATAVRITRRDGVVDYIYSAGDDTLRHIGDFEVAGRFAHIRVRDGKLIDLNLAGVSAFDGFGHSVRPANGRRVGTVASLDAAAKKVTTEATLPTDGSLNGEVITFANPRYTRNSAYRIARIERQGDRSIIHLAQSPILGKGQVDEILDKNTLLSSIQHEYANSMRGYGNPVRGDDDSGFFTGKSLRTVSGEKTSVSKISFLDGLMKVSVVDTSAIKPGEVFYYEDIQAGDSFEILGSCSPATKQ